MKPSNLSRTCDLSFATTLWSAIFRHLQGGDERSIKPEHRQKQ